MESSEPARVESETLSDFARVVRGGGCVPARPFGDGTRHAGRIDVNPDNVRNGLVRLVLTLVKLLHELLERQAIRRVDAGSLSSDQIERLGVTLMKQAQEIERLRMEFGLEDEDLNLDLGPLGTLL